MNCKKTQCSLEGTVLKNVYFNLRNITVSGISVIW